MDILYDHFTSEDQAHAEIEAAGYFPITIEFPPEKNDDHWHDFDSLLYVLEGEVALVTDAGEQTLRPGMAAGFKAGVPDGHHLVNRSDRSASYLEIGTRSPDDRVAYPDIDLLLEPRPGGRVFTNRRGEDY